ncbi:MAG: hypothetical protein OEL50_04140 [Rhodospirillaceae bacterium]|nr:hypothetical protein [Rhodospirillaceae bacterium]
MKRYLAFFYVIAVFFALPGRVGAADLLYFYSEACVYCDRWNEEVGSIYNKTEESSVLKLRPIDIHAKIPSDIEHIKGVVYTPTFVAVDGGREVGRIVGYGGDMFFWQNVEIILGDMKKKSSKSALSCPEGVSADSKASC